MTNSTKSIRDYPEISFIDNYTLRRLETEMLAWFVNQYKKLTGRTITLASADDRRIILQTAAYFMYQGYMFVDNAGKMGLLKYSLGDYLENLGARGKIHRDDAKGATTTIRFSMNSSRISATGIPAGTRVTAGDGIYFATNEYAEIAPGSLHVDVRATCLTTGKVGNDYQIGEINRIVDTVAMIDAVTNVTKSENGKDAESDDDLRERIYAAPDGYSSAGPKEAYAYFAREYNSSITDVDVKTPERCVVEVRCLLDDGIIPEEEFLSGLKEYISEKNKVPLTDKVYCMAPEQVKYELSLTYYINQSDKSMAEAIKSKVEDAINQYIVWQRSKIGRDINPDELRRLVINAGAKRVRVTKPEFKVLGEIEVGSLEESTKIVSYGGLEDD